MSSQGGDPVAMPIGEVARRTGVAVATLRAWERRYGLLCPTRTAGGHRRYSHQDVQRVVAVRELTGQGWTVAAAARQVAAQPPSRWVRPAAVQQLRGRLWGALDQALRELPAATAAPRSPGGPPTRGQPEAFAGGVAGAGPHRRSAGPVTVRQRPGATPPAAAAGPLDWQGLQAVHQATRALLYSTSVQQATEILIAAVQQLGGWTRPASQAGGWALPIDLSFGQGEPVLPVAEPLSPARMLLEQALPGLVEDARRAVVLLRRAKDLDG